MSYPYYNTNSTGSQYLLSAVQIQGTNISSAGANDNDVLTFDLATNQWQPEALPAPPAPNTLYTADGSLTGSRAVEVGANRLKFSNTGTATDFIDINNPLNIGGVLLNSQVGNITLFAQGVGTAKINLTADDDIVIQSATDILYQGSGAVDLVGGTTMTLNSPSIVLTQVPPNGDTNAKLLTRDATSGAIELRDVSTLPTNSNIYNTDGTLTALRTVNTGGFPLSITDGITNQLNISPIQTDLNNALSVSIGAPSVVLANAPALNNANTNLLSRNAGTGAIELRTVASINTGTANVIPFFDGSGNFTTNDTSNTYEPLAKSTKIGTNGSTAAGFYSAVLGGELNTGNGQSAVVLGGRSNAITGGAVRTGILAGESNSISGGLTGFSTIVGGTSNTIGNNSTTNTIIGSVGSNATTGAQNAILNSLGGTISGAGSNNLILNGVACIISAGSGSVMVADDQGSTNTNTQSQVMKLRFANGVNITNSTSNANNATSAMLQIDSTTKGVILPRMTTANKNAIVSPVNGLTVYDTNLSALQLYTSAWKYLRANAVEIAETPVSAVAPTANQILQLVAGTWTPSPLNDFIYFNSGGAVANNQYLQQNGQNGNILNTQLMVGRAGIITSLRIYLDVQTGVGGTRTFTVFLNGVATALIVSAVDGANNFVATGSIAVVATDLISIFHTAVSASASRAVATLTITA